MPAKMTTIKSASPPPIESKVRPNPEKLPPPGEVTVATSLSSCALNPKSPIRCSSAFQAAGSVSRRDCTCEPTCAPNTAISAASDPRTRRIDKAVEMPFDNLVYLQIISATARKIDATTTAPKIISSRMRSCQTRKNTAASPRTISTRRTKICSLSFFFAAIRYSVTGPALKPTLSATVPRRE